MTFSLHVISDLNLGYNEFSTYDEDIPNVDLVVLNGNIGQIKRGMLYAHTIANKYPTTQFVYNLGETELYLYNMEKFKGELVKQIELRKNTADSWPKNLHWSLDSMIINLRNGSRVDVLCTYGFPKIHSYVGDWQETHWFKHYMLDVTADDEFKLSETSNVRHGPAPIWATKESINAHHDLELQKVKDWELTQTSYKILVTHVNPLKDIRTGNQVVSPYLVHLNDMLWITSNTKVSAKFLGAKLVSNPGRGHMARSVVFNIDSMS